MKTYSKIAVSVALLCVVHAAPSVAELDTASYIDLSIERLALVEARLRQEGRSPTNAELDALWRAYGTSADEYVAFRAQNSESVAAHLATDLEAGARIDELSRQIDALMQALEGSPQESDKQ
jgi:hypothetical protein